LEQMIAKAGKLPLEVVDHLSHVAAGYCDALLTAGERAQQGWDNNNSHWVRKDQADLTSAAPRGVIFLSATRRLVR